MFNRMVVQEALNRSLAAENSIALLPVRKPVSQNTAISLLIHDIFGGEILKTHKKKGWHFYNRIDGERIDLTMSSNKKLPDDNRFEDIPSTPAETYNYFEMDDYSSFFMQFVIAFEEAVGLESYKQ